MVYEAEAAARIKKFHARVATLRNLDTTLSPGEMERARTSVRTKGNVRGLVQHALSRSPKTQDPGAVRLSRRLKPLKPHSFMRCAARPHATSCVTTIGVF